MRKYRASVDRPRVGVVAFRALSKGIGRARRLVLNASAKVNLVLEVLGKRDDGYHELVTVMQAVDLSDRLTLEDAEDLELDGRAAGVPTDDRNLALRAARALREAAGVDRGARITLDKRIPVAAGLGGGSADAAAVLLGLNRLWRLRWPVARHVHAESRRHRVDGTRHGRAVLPARRNRAGNRTRRADRAAAWPFARAGAGESTL